MLIVSYVVSCYLLCLLTFYYVYLFFSLVFQLFLMIENTLVSIINRIYVSHHAIASSPQQAFQDRILPKPKVVVTRISLPVQIFSQTFCSCSSFCFPF